MKTVNSFVASYIHISQNPDGFAIVATDNVRDYAKTKFTEPLTCRVPALGTEVT